MYLGWLYGFEELSAAAKRKARSPFPFSVEKDLYWKDQIDKGFNPIEVLVQKVKIHQTNATAGGSRRVRMYYDQQNSSERKLGRSELAYLCAMVPDDQFYDTPFG